MRYKNIVFHIFILISIFFLHCRMMLAQESEPVTYDLTIEELAQINVVADTSDFVLEPTYDLSIKDLMALEVVKELKVEKDLTISEDFPMEDILKIEIPVKKKRDKKEPSFQPNYEMSLQGLLEVEIKEDYKLETKITVSYDLSLEGLMNINIKRIKRE